jgi:glycosyltransferase involved in cell wall biosynthesis
MKILQVSNRVPWPLNEGGTIGIYNYTRAYHELGLEVTLYCLDGIKHNTPLAEATTELSKYAKILIHPIDTDINSEEAMRHLLRNESYNVSRFYNTVFDGELRDLLKKETFDIIQLEGTFTGPYIDTIKANHTGAVALRMHNVEYEIWERLSANERNPFKKMYLRILAKQLKTFEAKLLPKVNVIVTVTDDDAQKFKALHPTGNYLTIPAGIDLDTWKYTPSGNYTTWYHIGSMEWHANAEAVHWYLDAIHPLIQKADSRYKLSLAGKGIHARSFHPDSSLEINDNVPSAFEFVRDCDVCVVPLKSGSGIRLKILEAMAAGKLVVSTTVGAQGIDYTPEVDILIADKPSEFLAIYKRLMNGEIDTTTIVTNARKLVERNYSTDALAYKQVAFYKNLK